MQDKASEPTKHCCLPSLFRITLLLRPERLQFCILVCLVSIAFRVFFKLCNALPLDLSPLFLCSPKGLKACVHGLYVYVCVCICKCLCAFEVVCRPLSLSLSTSRPLSLDLSTSLSLSVKSHGLCCRRFFAFSARFVRLRIFLCSLRCSLDMDSSNLTFALFAGCPWPCPDGSDDDEDDDDGGAPFTPAAAPPSSSFLLLCCKDACSIPKHAGQSK